MFATHRYCFEAHSTPFVGTRAVSAVGVVISGGRYYGTGPLTRGATLRDTSRGAIRHRFLRQARGISRAAVRGQGLVEFALVLPLLLVLLLGIADFGRVFTAGITIEAAARNGAEAAAQEYLQLIHKPGGVLDAADYASLHDVALDAVCAETEPLPNQVKVGSSCTMPLAAVCIHDGGDPLCGVESDDGFPPEPGAPQCTGINGAWDPANNGATPLGATPLPYVEVRVCYQFTTLLNLTNLQLPFGWSLSLGEVWLQRDREFTVANY